MNMTVNEAIDKLNRLTESPHKQKLVKDLFYSTIDEILNREDPITKYTKINPEMLLQAYKANGYIKNNDTIVIPAGTIFTYKRTIEPDLFDIYHVQGKATCYIAVAPSDVVDLFGEYAYMENLVTKGTYHGNAE